LAGSAKALADPADRLAAEDQVLHLRKLVGQMTIVETSIDRPHEVGHPLP